MSEKRIGRQMPTNAVILPYNDSKGMEAIEIYNRSGRTAQQWQEILIEDIMAVNGENLWVHMKFGWSVPRRNGKSELAVMRAIYGIINGERVLYTAHRTTTSTMAYERKNAKVKCKPIFPSVSEVIEANTLFEKHLFEGLVCHKNQPSLAQIVANCEHRSIGSKGGLGYSSIIDGADISLLESVTLAHWICANSKEKKKQIITY